MNRLCSRFIIFILLIPLGVVAEEKLATGKFVVSFTAEASQKAWVVKALEQNVYNDLSGYGKIVSVQKALHEENKCKRRNIDCILEIYKKQGVDALMLGTVDKSHIDYRTYDVREKYLVRSGSIRIGKGSTLLKLRMGAFSAFKPFIEKGGILDKRASSAIEDSDTEAQQESIQIDQKYSNEKQKNQVLIFLAIFTLIPYLLSFIGKPLRHPERSKIILRWFWPFNIVCLLLIGYQYELNSTGTGNIFVVFLNLLDKQQWLVTGLGGITWAFFIIVIYKVIMPHLHGIERIKPNNLFPLLLSSSFTLLTKFLIISILYLGFFYVVWIAGTFFDINHTLIVLLLFPLSGLYIFCWFALMLDVFSMSIDVKFAYGKVDYKNVWNSSLHKYFISYLKRNGVALDPRLVRKIVFLPGNNKGVVCYGGGFSRPRIGINRDLIKFALGDIDDFNPQETAMFSKKVFRPVNTKSSVYHILADYSSPRTIKKLFSNRFDRKRAKQIEDMQHYLHSDLSHKRQSHFDHIDNVTEGIVLPKFQGPDAFPSLMSDNFDDMQIVQALLQENSMGADPYNEEAEIDDSSERDKDFLFGALLHKSGMLVRHDDIFSTIYWYFYRKKKSEKQTFRFTCPKYFSIVADTYVVLNFGLNHLLQFLYYQATNSPTHLTTKGMASGMLKSQGDILNATKELTDKDNPIAIQTNELSRITWLSRFSHESIEIREPAQRQTARLIKWIFFISLIYLTSFILLNAYNYHPKYNEVIAEEKQAIADAIKSEIEKERNAND